MIYSFSDIGLNLEQQTFGKKKEKYEVFLSFYFKELIVYDT